MKSIASSTGRGTVEVDIVRWNGQQEVILRSHSGSLALTHFMTVASAREMAAALIDVADSIEQPQAVEVAA